MSVVDCWSALFEGGNVRVDPPGAAGAAGIDERALADAIVRVEADRRMELAGDAPALVLPVATWAAQLVYAACQFLVYREVDPQMVSEGLSRPCPAAKSPAVCYSVDIAMRVLPELLRIARAASPEDVLVQSLKNLAREWPLSSVGEPVEEADVSPFIEHPSLRQLYADRIIASADATRLTDARVREAVRATIGAYPKLAAASIVAAMGESK